LAAGGERQGGGGEDGASGHGIAFLDGSGTTTGYVNGIAPIHEKGRMSLLGRFYRTGLFRDRRGPRTRS
ncbi:MAG: hypothetical protein NDI88_13385, partial [Lysobacter sp.]|nr:hypothetical protein [Lysobacter sp.]